MYFGRLLNKQMNAIVAYYQNKVDWLSKNKPKKNSCAKKWKKEWAKTKILLNRTLLKIVEQI